MPGRLLSLVRAAPASSPPLDQLKSHKKPSDTPPLFPPVYSVERPSQKNKSQESLVMEAFKRHGLGTRQNSFKKSPKGSPKAEPQPAAKLNMVVESPPLVFFNSPQTSTGAIISGLLNIEVHEPNVTLQSLEMRLLAIVTTKKPVHQHCPDCASQTTEIHKWDFLRAAAPLHFGQHSYPFSHLVPGHLPATTHGQITTLDYYLDAAGILSNGKKLEYKRALDIKRSIVPGPDKHSIRIFPPTNLTASVKLPPVVHPIGDFPVEMRLSGVTQTKDDSQSRWRLRKLNWRIEETQKSISPACPKHANKVGGEGKGILHDDTRTIASDEVKTGWKTDFVEGNVDCEFRARCNISHNPLCDMDSQSGMSVRHNLVIEMVVAEEWAPLKKLSQATPTGAARVLRTQFHLVLTERSGMGISWDEEQPPLYEDVPASPPTYIGDYTGPPLHDDDLHLGP
jgi:hypothetical protein